MKRRWFIILFFIMAIALLILGLKESDLRTTNPAIKGLLDISQKEMHDGVVRLEGQWEFYWSQLLSPEDFPRSKVSYAELPSLWNGMEWEGQRLTGRGYATYRLKVVLPGNSTGLGMKVYDTYCSFRMYINGQLVARNGEPGVDKQHAAPFWESQLVALPDGLDTLDCVLQVANFWTYKGGVYKAPDLAYLSILRHNDDVAWGMDVFLTGSFFMTGLLFLALYLFTKEDKSILYFSLFCLAYSYRIIGTDPYYLHWFLHHLGWFLTARLEYGSLSLSVALFSLYIFYLYPEENNKTLVRVLFWISMVYTGIIVVMPPQVFTAILPYYLWLLFFYIGYAFYVFVKAYQHRRYGFDYAFLSSGLLVILFLVLNLNYFGVMASMKTAIFAGYLTFLFLQAIILSHRVAFRLRKAAEDARQGLMAKSEFLSTMSHEIRTPLNAILGLVYILNKTELTAKQRETLDAISFSGHNLLTLSNDVLDYNKLVERKISLEESAMDIRQLAEHIYLGQRTIAERKNISLNYTVDDRLPKVLLGDAGKITQVITNLVHNAIKFTQHGGVAFSISLDKTEGERVMLTVRVEDSGIGIPAKNREKIFDRFVQADSTTSRKYGGSGLGLPICKEILELYQSKLEFVSNPGEGSTFWFSLSLSVAGQDEQPANGMLWWKYDSFKGLSILLVEDNLLNAMITTAMLEDAQISVTWAKNGREAIEKFSPGAFHLVFMDLSMPEMDGFETTRQLRKLDAKIPVIAVTATIASDVISKAKDAGITDILVKPFEPGDLYAKIRNHSDSPVL